MRGSNAKKSVDMTPQSRMRGYLQLVATGPELSRSLNATEAEDAMSMILNGEIDEVRTGIFLIALRMKRESDAENLGILNALIQEMEQTEVRCPEVLVLADPFNGYLRGLSATSFLPAVLAASGLPSYLHGLHAVGPKYGMTANMILAAAGVHVDASVAEAAVSLENPEIGWAYIDQKRYIPRLADLVGLRDVMVKRSCISTLEVILRPLCGARCTHLMTGFVHKAYPPVYAMLARHAGYGSASIVRGVEGGCIPSLSQVSRYFGYRGEEEIEVYKLTPGELGIHQEKRAIAIPDEHAPEVANTGFLNTGVLEDLVELNLELGLDALANRSGPMLDSLVYGAAIGLKQSGMNRTLADGAAQARKVIARGEALARFKAGRMQ